MKIQTRLLGQVLSSRSLLDTVWWVEVGPSVEEPDSKHTVSVFQDFHRLACQAASAVCCCMVLN